MVLHCHCSNRLTSLAGAILNLAGTFDFKIDLILRFGCGLLSKVGIPGCGMGSALLMPAAGRDAVFLRFHGVR